jgi:hypothetical protein
MKINVEQYQALYTIPSGTTGNDYTTKVLDIFNIDGSKYTIKEINEVVNGIKIPSIKKLDKFNITIVNSKFTIVNNIMKSTFNEFIQYEALVGSSPDEATIIKNLHKVLAIFVRPTIGSLFWKRIKPLDKTDIIENEKMMLKMNIEDAIAINVFFYQRELTFIQNTKKHYLNQRSLMSTATVTKNKLAQLIAPSDGTS